MSDHIKFSALLCSRLCHDLVNPVGAFANGLELLAEEDDPEMRRQVMDLLANSAEQTAKRLQFFRLAFGAGGGFGETVAATVVRDAAVAYLLGSKVTLDWRDNAAELTRDGVKVLLNLILIGSETLLRGGSLVVASGRANGTLELRVTVEGERLLVKEGMAPALRGETAIESLDPKTASAYLAANVAQAAGGTIELAQPDEKTLSLTAHLP